MAAQDIRPFFLNLLKIRLPISGVVSIMHRVSGVLMFVCIPLVIYLLELSLRNGPGFEQVAHWLTQPLGKLIVLLLIAALLHHLFAGIRFLLIDFDIGLGKSQSLRSAWLVIIIEVLLMLWIALSVYL